MIQFLVFFPQAAWVFHLLVFFIYDAGAGTSAARDLIQVFAAVDHHPLHRDVVRVQVMADIAVPGGNLLGTVVVGQGNEILIKLVAVLFQLLFRCIADGFFGGVEEPSFRSQLFAVIHLLLPGFLGNPVKLRIPFLTVTVIFFIMVALNILNHGFGMPGAVAFGVGVIVHIGMCLGIYSAAKAVRLIKVSVLACHIQVPVAGILVFPAGELGASVIGPVVFCTDVPCFGNRVVQIGIPQLGPGLVPLAQGIIL